MAAQSVRSLMRCLLPDPCQTKAPRHAIVVQLPLEHHTELKHLCSMTTMCKTPPRRPHIAARMNDCRGPPCRPPSVAYLRQRRLQVPGLLPLAVGGLAVGQAATLGGGLLAVSGPPHLEHLRMDGGRRIDPTLALLGDLHRRVARPPAGAEIHCGRVSAPGRSARDHDRRQRPVDTGLATLRCMHGITRLADVGRSSAQSMADDSVHLNYMQRLPMLMSMLLQVCAPHLTIPVEGHAVLVGAVVHVGAVEVRIELAQQRLVLSDARFVSAHGGSCHVKGCRERILLAVRQRPRAASAATLLAER